MQEDECWSKQYHYIKSATCWATDRWCRLNIYKCAECGKYIYKCQCGSSNESKCTCLPDCSICGKEYNPRENELFPYCSKECKNKDITIANAIRGNNDD